MITRYFIVNEIEQKDHTANIVPDNDILPLSSLEAVTIATLADGRKIIHAMIPVFLIAELQEQTGLQNPLSVEGVEKLDLKDKYIGTSIDDVIEMFPELIGHIMPHVWCDD